VTHGFSADIGRFIAISRFSQSVISARPGGQLTYVKFNRPGTC